MADDPSRLGRRAPRWSRRRSPRRHSNASIVAAYSSRHSSRPAQRLRRNRAVLPGAAPQRGDRRDPLASGSLRAHARHTRTAGSSSTRRRRRRRGRSFTCPRYLNGARSTHERVLHVVEQHAKLTGLGADPVERRGQLLLAGRHVPSDVRHRPARRDHLHRASTCAGPHGRSRESSRPQHQHEDPDRSRQRDQHEHGDQHLMVVSQVTAASIARRRLRPCTQALACSTASTGHVHTPLPALAPDAAVRARFGEVHGRAAHRRRRTVSARARCSACRTGRTAAPRPDSPPIRAPRSSRATSTCAARRSPRRRSSPTTTSTRTACSRRSCCSEAPSHRAASGTAGDRRRRGRRLPHLDRARGGAVRDGADGDGRAHDDARSPTCCARSTGAAGHDSGGCDHHRPAATRRRAVARPGALPPLVGAAVGDVRARSRDSWTPGMATITESPAATSRSSVAPSALAVRRPSRASTRMRVLTATPDGVLVLEHRYETWVRYVSRDR